MIKHVKNLNLAFFLLITLSLLLPSCKQQDIFEGPVVLYAGQDAVITYQIDRDEIEFFLDILSDTTENFSASAPTTDFARIYFDANNNGRTDSMIDMKISNLRDGRLCYSYLLDSTRSSSPCYFHDQATTERRFTATENADDMHVNYRFRINKKLIGPNSQCKIVIWVFDPAKGFTHFPQDWAMFSKAYEISL